MINIVIQHNVADMTSGASYSLLGLVKEIKSQGKYNPIVILPENGELQQVLEKYKIDNYVVRQRNLWSVGVDSNVFKNIIKEGISAVFYLKEYNAIKRILIKRNVKLVHVNMLTCGLVGKVAIDLNIPVVWHMREFLEQDIGVRLVHFSSRKKVIDQSKQMIAVSKSIKKNFETVFAPKINVIYNGIDFDTNSITEHAIFNKPKVKVAIVGRICKGKGQLEAIKACEQLYNDTGIEYQLDMYGSIQEEEYFSEITKYITNNHAETRISYKGRTENTIKMLTGYDILCVCSNLEAFGRTTIEGMAAGCLVVGADSGGTSELIKNGVTGYKYRPHDIYNFTNVLMKAVKMPELSNKIAKNSQKFALSNFSVEKNAQGVMKVYDEVLCNN